MPVAQALALFVKVIKKISKLLLDVQKAAIGADIPEEPPAPARLTADGTNNNWEPVGASIEEELAMAGDEATSALREKQRAMIDSLDLTK